MLKTWAQMDTEFAMQSGGIMGDSAEATEKFNHHNLLESMNSATNMDDVDAIFLVHKFNDHNLR